VLYQPQHAGARLRDRSFLTSDRRFFVAARSFICIDGRLSSLGASDPIPFLQRAAHAVVEICLTLLNEGERRTRSPQPFTLKPTINEIPQWRYRDFIHPWFPDEVEWSPSASEPPSCSFSFFDFAASGFSSSGDAPGGSRSFRNSRRRQMVQAGAGIEPARPVLGAPASHSGARTISRNLPRRLPRLSNYRSCNSARA